MPKQGAQHDEIFHGVGRGSLAKGDNGRDYRGHIFWDNEVYMLPAVVLFHPTLAKVSRNLLRNENIDTRIFSRLREIEGPKVTKLHYERSGVD